MRGPATLPDCRARQLGRSLLQEAHGFAGHPMFDGRQLHWKYWQPREDWQGSRCYVLTRDELIIAHAAVVPAVCSWESERRNVLQHGSCRTFI